MTLPFFIALLFLTVGVGFSLGYMSGRMKRAVARMQRAENERDTAYQDRARILAVLAAQFESSLEHDDTAALDSEWLWVLIIRLPKVEYGGVPVQVSWHVKASDLWMFNHVPRQLGLVWDRHTTPEKNVRMETWCKEKSG